MMFSPQHLVYGSGKLQPEPVVSTLLLITNSLIDELMIAIIDTKITFKDIIQRRKAQTLDLFEALQPHNRNNNNYKALG